MAALDANGPVVGPYMPMAFPSNSAAQLGRWGSSERSGDWMVSALARLLKRCGGLRARACLLRD